MTNLYFVVWSGPVVNGGERETKLPSMVIARDRRSALRAIADDPAMDRMDHTGLPASVTVTFLAEVPTAPQIVSRNG